MRDNYRVCDVCFLLGWLLKPVYLHMSGTVQAGDILMFLGMILCFLRERKLLVDDRDKWLVLFAASTWVINFTYALVYHETVFLRPVLYFSFNFLLVLFLRQRLKNESFVRAILIVSLCNIFIQILVFVLGLGRYFSIEHRYMGTYNDPNAFAYAMLTYAVIFFIAESGQMGICFGLTILVGMLIILSKSIAMLLAWGLFFLYQGWLFVNKHRKYAAPAVVLTIIAGLAAAVAVYVLGHDGQGAVIEFSMYDRLAKKISAGGNIFSWYISDRNLYAAAENPVYFLFGAGEGCFSRFTERTNELHNSWISVLFCYGIIPFSFLMKWIYSNLKDVKRQSLAVVWIMCFEACFLINYRQPMFWLIFLLPEICTEGSLIAGTGNKTVK